jgi:hypothetical protein
MQTAGFMIGNVIAYAYDLENHTFFYSREFLEKEEDFPGVMDLMGRDQAGWWDKEDQVEIIMKELNAKADVYFIDELGKMEMSSQIKDKIVDLMNDPAKLVVATGPLAKPESDESFVKYIKSLS